MLELIDVSAVMTQVSNPAANLTACMSVSRRDYLGSSLKFCSELFSWECKYSLCSDIKWSEKLI